MVWIFVQQESSVRGHCPLVRACFEQAFLGSTKEMPTGAIVSPQIVMVRLYTSPQLLLLTIKFTLKSDNCKIGDI